MESFKRTPTNRMLAAEVMDTTVELQSGGDKNQYLPAIYLSPTGAEVNRVLIAGTAVEKEDVGTDNSFWRVRIADPTGVIFVYAGQYQPEAAKAIQKLEVPCFVIVSGKLAHYNPERGGDTIISMRAESIAAVSIELRDLALADIAHHTVKRLLEARKNQKVQDNYPNYDYSTFIQSISTLLDQILEEQAVNNAPAAPASQPVPPSTQALALPSPPAVQAPAAETSKPVPPAEVQKSAKPPEPAVQPSTQPSAVSKKTRKSGKREGSKNDSLNQSLTETPKEPAKEQPVKEAQKIESKTYEIQGSDFLVLDILRTHKAGVKKDTLQNVLRSLGYAMLDVDSITANLKSAGEIIEPTDGLFRVV